MKALLTLLLFCTFSHSADIAALVIGNNAYLKPEDQLDTPVADAELMKRTLEALPGGADVSILRDATKEDIELALNSLKARAQGAKLALIFYSGHGMEGQPQGFVKEDTFLLPVEADIPHVDRLATRAVSLSSLLAALKEAPVTARAVILDCCRTGAPRATAALAGASKSFGSGADIDEGVKAALGKAVVPEATLIAFAASPGRKAAAFLNVTDANSPFTQFLAEQLSTGAGNLRDLVEAAAETTETRTERRQVPFVSYTGAASAIRQITFRTAAKPVTLVPMTEAEIQRRALELAKKMVPNGSAGVPPVSVPPAAGSTVPSLSTGRIGQTYTATLPGGQSLTLCYCPAGTFTMGSPFSEPDRKEDEEQVQVTLSKSFWMSRTEVTQAQWQAVMGSNPSHFKGNQLPVEKVSWYDAQAFVKKLNSQSSMPAGWEWSLPTEAQWEYACRAGTRTATAFGNSLSASQANFNGNYPYGSAAKGNYLDKTNSVGSYNANDWGLHDMHGNVSEWCINSWDGESKLLGGTDPVSITGSSRVARDGSWFFHGGHCRSAYRGGFGPERSSFILGIRLSVVPVKPASNIPSLGAATKEATFTNSLGMKFVTVPGTKVWFSIYETRRQDYAAYAAACSGVDSTWKTVEYKGQPVGHADDHPVVSVSYDDSLVFCDWLSKKEGRTYRLPTDHEWSVAVGGLSAENASHSPKTKDHAIKGVYPWGGDYPPATRLGNYADSAAKAKGTATLGVIEGYTDSYATTAPVGSFSANLHGLYDMGGNVWEWCQDFYDGQRGARVLRGASWSNDGSDHLASSYRRLGFAEVRVSYTGFRVVLEVGASR